MRADTRGEHEQRAEGQPGLCEYWVTSPLVSAELEALDGIEVLALSVSELRENVKVGTVC